ncbi:MAG: dihydrofolate reductase [Crocinitomicaceae bacterium]|jgi:dihydrofolate reductase|nr:dihydrofolate reductase [Crocinitomicaceae bacterium]
MKVKLIVAMDASSGIGKNNDLLWHLPADMKFFRETTTGHIVVMGRKNYESIPERFRPLPNRENAVLTRQADFEAPGCVVFNSLTACLEHYRNESERIVFIIGGGQIYNEALRLDCVDEMFITHVETSLDADTFFPACDPADWEAEIILEHPADEKNPYAFTVKKYTRTRS